ncbi:MAG TPA: hypothetical protein VIP77_04885 [Jiangellaceae bacterium]
MKIVTTPSELMDRLRWEEACDMLGLNVYAVAEGLMDGGEEITLSEEQAVTLGLLPKQERP